MKKYIRAFAMLCIAAILAFPIKAFAFSGASESVTVKLKNLDGKECYGTLLSDRDSYGPNRVWDGETVPAELLGGEAVWKAFVNYSDGDGYYFLNNWFDCSSGEFTWGYMPPSDFKVLLYFPADGTFVVSDKLEISVYDTVVSMNLKNVAFSGGTVQVNAKAYYNYLRLLWIVLALIIAYVVEIGLLYLLFTKDKKTVKFVMITNGIFKLALCIGLFLFDMNTGMAALGAVEFGIFEIVAETVIYVIFLGKQAEQKPNRLKNLGYGLLANVTATAVTAAVLLWLCG